jgi:hypothetical protein
MPEPAPAAQSLDEAVFFGEFSEQCLELLFQQMVRPVYQADDDVGAGFRIPDFKIGRKDRTGLLLPICRAVFA